nr:restriction endonuclease subunit S [Candidatus Brocadiales bacterium]
KSEFSPDCKEGYIRLIQIRDYKSDKHIVFIPKEKARRFCDKTDVMIGRYGPPLFQILRGLNGAYNVALMKAIPDESKITKDFLYYFLKNGDILQYIINASSRSAGPSGINKATIEPYPIAYPSLEEQANIVSSLDGLLEDIQRLETIYQEKLAALKELKQSLLQKAFSGELTAEGDKLMDEAVA